MFNYHINDDLMSFSDCYPSHLQFAVMVFDQGRKAPVVCGARKSQPYRIPRFRCESCDGPSVGPSIVCQESVRLHVVVRSILVFNDG